MKNYIKGIITGIIIGAVIYSIPALADTIDALFNNVRISVNGVDQIQWGENIKLSDGAETPASILYNGTTYLPMRKLGELSGNKIYWNGDSRTVGMTGAQKDIKVIAEKPDKNGNVWKYYTFKAEEYVNYPDAKKQYIESDFLGVKDEQRGYERIYRIVGDVAVEDDALYFFKSVRDSGYPSHYRGRNGVSETGYITKLEFNNDENSQDGEMLKHATGVYQCGILENGYLYYVSLVPQNSSYSEFVVYNYLTNEYDTHSGGTWDTGYVEGVTYSDNKIIFDYTEYRTDDLYLTTKQIFDRDKNKFAGMAVGEIVDKDKSEDAQ